MKISVEKDVESLVSMYEKYLMVDRQMDEENKVEEMNFFRKLTSFGSCIQLSQEGYEQLMEEKRIWELLICTETV